MIIGLNWIKTPHKTPACVENLNLFNTTIVCHHCFVLTALYSSQYHSHSYIAGWRRPPVPGDYSHRGHWQGLHAVVWRRMQIRDIDKGSTIYNQQWGLDSQYGTTVAQGVPQSHPLHCCLRLCDEAIGAGDGQHSSATRVRGACGRHSGTYWLCGKLIILLHWLCKSSPILCGYLSINSITTGSRTHWNYHDINRTEIILVPTLI